MGNPGNGSRWRLKQLLGRIKAKDIEIEGENKLKRQFLRISESVAGKALVEATEKGAEVAVQDAKQNAPERTGEGARSIHGAVTLEEPTVAKWGISWDEEHYYMRFQEMGWTDPGGTYHSPKNFLKESIVGREAQINDAIQKELRELILGAINGNR